MKSEIGFMHLLVAGEMILLVVLVIFGVARKVAGPEEQADIIINTQTSQMEQWSESSEVMTETSQTEETETEQEAEVVFSEEVEQVLSEMSLEEKVAQLFIVSPEALTGMDKVTIAGEGTRSALETYPVGGMLYERQNLLGQVQIRDLVQGARSISMEQNGRYLFAGVLKQTAEETILIDVPTGQETMLLEMFTAEDIFTVSGTAEMEQILYVNEIEALSMESESERLCCYSVAENDLSAVMAINSGADMLCVTGEFPSVYTTVLEAAENGEISEMVLKKAVGRILTRKQVLSQ